MAQRFRHSRLRRSLVHAAAGTLCPIAPLVVFLTANDYSVIAAEVWLLYGVAAICGLLLAGLAVSRYRLATRIGLWAVVTASVLLMLQTAPVVAMIAVAVLAAGVIAVLRNTAAEIFAIAAIVHITATMLLTQFEPSTSMQTTRNETGIAVRAGSAPPPVLHIVLDEFIGPYGLPTENGRTARVRNRISSVFEANGFNVYGRAYTQYLSTYDSLSNLFNFDSSPVQQKYYSRTSSPPVMWANRYFEMLQDRGYAIHVYQSAHIDYCSSPTAAVSSCTRYRANSIEAIGGIDMAAPQKARFILNSFLQTVRAWRGVRRVYNHVVERFIPGLPAWGLAKIHTGPLTSLPIAAKLAADLETMRPGQVYFAHLMMPHYPYVLEADCAVKTTLESWLYRAPRGLLRTLGQQNDEASRILRYRHYLDQYECTLEIIERILEPVRNGDAWRDALIIVHGDHGSRIVQRFPTAGEDAVSDADYRDVYSTFFAVKRGSSSGGVTSTLLPLQSILADVWQLPNPAPQEHLVFAAELGAADLVALPLRGFGAGE